MKKFVLKVLLLFFCVVIMDFVFGQFFAYLRTHAKGGSTENCEYIANRCQDDIIILGSSRATHHYVPQIIEDLLGVSCYNCGEEGNGVVLAYGRLMMLTARYTPRLILYEVTPGYDYGTAEPDTKYIGYLRSYYDKDGIKRIIDDFDDDLSWLKMKSKMYRNTGRLLPNLLDNIVLRSNNKGYSPLYGQLNISNRTSQTTRKQEMTVDTLKLKYLEKIIILCKSKQIPLYFMISPRYESKGFDMTSFMPAFILAEKYGVPVSNYIYYPLISENNKFFQDRGHMNDNGAVAYTEMLVKEVLKKKTYERNSTRRR